MLTLLCVIVINIVVVFFSKKKCVCVCPFLISQRSRSRLREHNYSLPTLVIYKKAIMAAYIASHYPFLFSNTSQLSWREIINGRTLALIPNFSVYITAIVIITRAPSKTHMHIEPLIECFFLQQNRRRRGGKRRWDETRSNWIHTFQIEKLNTTLYFFILFSF